MPCQHRYLHPNLDRRVLRHQPRPPDVEHLPGLQSLNGPVERAPAFAELRVVVVYRVAGELLRGLARGPDFIVGERRVTLRVQEP
jgi:hypothetical protein